MATTFPASLDSFTNPLSTDTLDGNAGAKPAVYHDVQHSNHNDAIRALEIKVGAGPTSIVAAKYSQVATDSVLLCDASGIAFPSQVITLLSSTANTGSTLLVKKIDSSNIPVVVVGTSGQTIDGQASYTLSDPGQQVKLFADGSNYRVIGV